MFILWKNKHTWKSQMDYFQFLLNFGALFLVFGHSFESSSSILSLSLPFFGHSFRTGLQGVWNGWSVIGCPLLDSIQSNQVSQSTNVLRALAPAKTGDENDCICNPIPQQGGSSPTGILPWKNFEFQSLKNAILLHHSGRHFDLFADAF